MYCKNCGASMNDKAAVCVTCGAKKNVGHNYCPNCGEATNPSASVCLKCGVSLSGSGSGNAKSKTTAGLLGIFLGAFGVHNFYLGHKTKAFIQLALGIFTVGTVSSIWGLIEGIMILTGSINTDGNGNPLE